MIVGYYNKSIILTFMGLFSTIIGINFSLNGNLYEALICLLISGICDTFDGSIANMVKRNKEEKKYGVELDSLVDVICFGVFPIILCFNLGYKSIIDIIIYCFYMFCGVTRLAYFNVDRDNKKYFKGLPITMSAFILAIVMLITINKIVIRISLILLAIAFILKFKIPKSGLGLKIIYLFIGILIIGLMISKII